jgi:hypothetical protein
MKFHHWSLFEVQAEKEPGLRFGQEADDWPG